MGGCVSTVLSVRNDLSVSPSREVQDYHARRNAVHGCFTVPVTCSTHASCDNDNSNDNNKHDTKRNNDSHASSCRLTGTLPYRLAGISDAMHATLMRGMADDTMNYVEQLRQLCEQHATRRAVAYRPIERVCSERVADTTTTTPAAAAVGKGGDGKSGSGSSGGTRELQITYLRPTCYLTFGELWERIDAFGRALREIGLPSRCHVSLFLDTCVEWLVGIYGMWTQDMVAVTVYANLGHDALVYALRETASGAVLTSAAQVPRLLALMQQGDLPCTPIVYTGKLPPHTQSCNSNNNNSHSNNKSSCAHAQLYSFDDLLDLGRAQRKMLARDSSPSGPSSSTSTSTSPHKSSTILTTSTTATTAAAAASSTTTKDAPTSTRSCASVPDATACTCRNRDVALIMYTSGTTGNPKGVVHTHGSLFYGATMLGMRVTDIIGAPHEDDVYCAYLPLAHIMEFTVVNIFLARGCLIGFGSPRTLTDATARPHGDLREYKPIIVVGVPRIFDTVRKAIEARLPPRGTLKRRIFDNAYATRLRALKAGNDTPYYNAKVFGAVRALFGGRVRALLCGGGPLSTATQEFVTVVLGTVVIGYGLTETVCVGAIQLLGDMERNITGNLIAGSEMKLVDVDGYTHADTPEPRGEICVRGPFLFKGYYKQPELTRQVLDDDGWFHTGDVGSMTTDGKLRIVGRIKALAKNALGEYIALETLEALYCSNSLCIPGCVCVLVHAHAPYIAALVLTDKDKAMAFARTHGIDGAWPDILQQPAFHTAAATSLAATAKAAGRQPFECVKYVRVLADEWTPENGLVTAAMKLKRHAIDDHYASVIAELFAH